ncbi:histidine phosphatase family protein [Paraburkholderia acidisoli]|uniref:Histidine phosphatase family protein n=1 Tax=Paraburkholderia acidisoli TaxID=2571748 RepID=A0A7Z2GHY2_9BURK|nr:histidine phosphatase family protein [Paraburkholderia acidisoli]QGZ61765.1 histidine phosphatase family protein [Paraburkholderia acidisoli]
MSMKVWLVSHAANAALRAGTFPVAVDTNDAADPGVAEDGASEAPEALDACASEAIGAWRARWLASIGDGARVVASPAPIARATARAAVCAPAAAMEIERCDAIAEAHFGAWQGQRLVDIARETPAALAAWTRDPAFAPPGGGESFDDLRRRVAAWLDGLRHPADVGTHARTEARIVAFTHASVIRAALLHALGAPSAGFRAIEIAPLDVAVLRAGREGWVWVAGVA